MAVDTKVNNTMLTILKSESNLLGINRSFEAEVTYTKEVFWVSRSCESRFYGLYLLRQKHCLSPLESVTKGYI